MYLFFYCFQDSDKKKEMDPPPQVKNTLSKEEKLTQSVLLKENEKDITKEKEKQVYIYLTIDNYNSICLSNCY